MSTCADGSFDMSCSFMASMSCGFPGVDESFMYLFSSCISSISYGLLVVTGVDPCCFCNSRSSALVDIFRFPGVLLHPAAVAAGVIVVLGGIGGLFIWWK